MPSITIKELQCNKDSWTVDVIFGGASHTTVVRDPFTLEGEEDLDWYFEKHLNFPFVDRPRATKARKSIQRYGQALFTQLFSTDEDTAKCYRDCRVNQQNRFHIEVEGSSPFHRLHWEALWDCDDAEPMSTRVPVTRRVVPAHDPGIVFDQPKWTALNILLVVARPGRGFDVGYRTMSHPLMELIGKMHAPVVVDHVRPGTFASLKQALADAEDKHGKGYYHIVHLDVHGKSDGHKSASLIFQGAEPGERDYISGADFAVLMRDYEIPVVLLNACQSAKERGDSASSVGVLLAQSGVKVILAMSYSVRVTAAQTFMSMLYRCLLGGSDVLASVCAARQELFMHKTRMTIANESFELEDWLIPVLYHNTVVNFNLSGAAMDALKSRSFSLQYPFVGRDIDILLLEHRLLVGHNVVLIRGLAGIGKSTLVLYVAHWWQDTGLVDQVLYFSCNTSLCTAAEIILRVAKVLFPEDSSETLSLKQQRVRVVQTLNSRRHVLIIDDLRSASISSGNFKLSPTELAEVKDFLRDLAHGKTLILLVSRSPVTWLDLSCKKCRENIYELRGIDYESSFDLVSMILQQHRVEDASLLDERVQELIRTLDGHVGGLVCIFANLGQFEPETIIDKLNAGRVSIQDIPPEADSSTSNTLSLCVDLSYESLPERERILFLCLAPFTSFVNCKGPNLARYMEELRKRTRFGSYRASALSRIVKVSEDWGLMRDVRSEATLANTDLTNIRRMHPLLPYFLRAVLNKAENHDLRTDVEIAFQNHYANLCHSMLDDLSSHSPKPRNKVREEMKIEHSNFLSALKIMCTTSTLSWEPLDVLEALKHYYFLAKTPAQGLELTQVLLNHIRSQTPVEEGLNEFAIMATIELTLDWAAWSCFLKDTATAKVQCGKGWEIWKANINTFPLLPLILLARLYIVEGMIAMGEQDYGSAVRHFQTALKMRKPPTTMKMEVEADLLKKLGSSFLALEKYDEAKGALSEALRLLETLDIPEDQMDVHLQLGIIASMQSESSEAGKQYAIASSLGQKTGSLKGLGELQLYLAQKAASADQWEEVERHCIEALKVAGSLPRYMLACAHSMLGTAKYFQGVYGEAEEYHQKAIALFDASSDRIELARSGLQLGQVLLKLAKLNEAKERLEGALELAKVLGDAGLQVEIHLALADVGVSTRSPADIRRHCALAQRICDEHGAQVDTTSLEKVAAALELKGTATTHLKTLRVHHSGTVVDSERVTTQ